MLNLTLYVPGGCHGVKVRVIVSVTVAFVVKGLVLGGLVTEPEPY